MKAADVKVGDKLVLNMGYGPHGLNEVCKVVSVKHTTNLFKSEVVRFEVTRPNGEKVDVVDYRPDDTVGTLEELL